MSDKPSSVTSYSDVANLFALGTGSALLGFVSRSFPLFRLWLGIVPALVISLALLAYGLVPQLREYARWSQQRVGGVRAAGPKFWSLHRLIMAIGPSAVFVFLVLIGAALG